MLEERIVIEVFLELEDGETRIVPITIRKNAIDAHWPNPENSNQSCLIINGTKIIGKIDYEELDKRLNNSLFDVAFQN